MKKKVGFIYFRKGMDRCMYR